MQTLWASVVSSVNWAFFPLELLLRRERDNERWVMGRNGCNPIPLYLFTNITKSEKQRIWDFDQFTNCPKDSKDSVAKPGQTTQIQKIWDSKPEILVDLLLEKFLTKKKGQLLSENKPQAPSHHGQPGWGFWGKPRSSRSHPRTGHDNYGKHPASQKRPEKRNPVSTQIKLILSLSNPSSPEPMVWHSSRPRRTQQS